MPGQSETSEEGPRYFTSQGEFSIDPSQTYPGGTERDWNRRAYWTTRRGPDGSSESDDPEREGLQVEICWTSAMGRHLSASVDPENNNDPYITALREIGPDSVLGGYSNLMDRGEASCSRCGDSDCAFVFTLDHLVQVTDRIRETLTTIHDCEALDRENARRDRLGLARVRLHPPPPPEEAEPDFPPWVWAEIAVENYRQELEQGHSDGDGDDEATDEEREEDEQSRTSDTQQ